MEDYRQAEQDLLLGILDALPCPTVLLNRLGQTVYVNGRSCPIDLSAVNFALLSEVKTALEGVSQTACRIELHGGGGGAAGLLELYPVNADEDLVGALLLFRPDPIREALTADALPTLSPVMTAIWERMARLALLNTPALFMGEPGVGKSDFAKTLHEMSAKQNTSRPFLTVHAEDMPEKLWELAAGAENGTLFCHRIDHWPESLLEAAVELFASRKIFRGGGYIPLRARLISSAEPTLPEQAARGKFSADLFTRMNVMPVFIPPLRDRPEDILPAANRYAAAAAARLNKDIGGFTEDASGILSRYDWKENLRELEACVNRAVAECPGGLILASYLGALHQGGASSRVPLRRMREAYGRDHIRALLNVYGHSVEGKKKAAAELGISLATLYRILGSKR